MNKFLTTLALGLFLTSTAAWSQNFIDPGVAMKFNGVGTVTMSDGTVYEEAIFKSYAMKKGLVKKLWFTTADGEKMKVKGEALEAFFFPPSALSQATNAVANLTDVTKMTQANFDDVIDREFIYYEAGTIPGRKPITLLMQLVNPGFDTKIKVYSNPRGVSTVGVGGVTATIVKSYYVAKDDQVYLIEKKKYEEQFAELFGDCPELIETYGADPDWKDFAAHVFAYDQACE